jgi:hypothetical protein
MRFTQLGAPASTEKSVPETYTVLIVNSLFLTIPTFQLSGQV